MSRKSIIHGHPQQKEIEEALARREKPIRVLAEEFNVPPGALTRYAHAHVTPAVRKAMEKRQELTGKGVVDEIFSQVGYLKGLLDAIIERFIDPETGKLALVVDTSMIEVLMEEAVTDPATGKTRSLRRKRLLSDVANAIPGAVSIFVKRDDLMGTFAKLSSVLKDYLEQLGKISGVLRTNIDVNVDMRVYEEMHFTGDMLSRKGPVNEYAATQQRIFDRLTPEEQDHYREILRQLAMEEAEELENPSERADRKKLLGEAPDEL